ncbi:hypothetical protein ACFSUD_19045 [Sulfitobacter aestuarii]|uniref:Polysaccharide biosynthesis protein n=1 Tax=Sulfitobacter aestuarii TaxID=2161676 RepID=A0ABW5U770_9RHOB
MIFTAAKMLNSLAILQGFYFAAHGGGDPSYFLFFSIYLYFFSVAEYCEGAFLVRGIRPGCWHFVGKGLFFALISCGLMLLVGEGAGQEVIALTALFAVLPLLSYWSGPSRDKVADRVFFAIMLLSLIFFSVLLWFVDAGAAFIAYIALYALAAHKRGRTQAFSPREMPEGANLLQLSAVALFVPAPRYMDLFFLQMLGASQADMTASLGFRVANISVRLPMFIYANFIPPRIGSLDMAFRGRYFALAATAALAAFVVCYAAVYLVAPQVQPLPLALYALAICLAAYIGEILRFFASGGILFRVSLLAPLLMVPFFWLLFDLVGLTFDVAFAGCFSMAVIPLVLWAYRVEYRREGAR